ncbi:MAG: OmpA family protein [Leptolyngbyaceae cyanobacterium bins.302]|nr:OmpA family protein [Leptolyngbyaceae cyanobacterium bins.302]
MTFSRILKKFSRRSCFWIGGGVLSLVLMGCNQTTAVTTTQPPESTVEISQMPASQMTQGASTESTATAQSQTATPGQNESTATTASSVQIQQAPQSTPLSIEKTLSELDAKKTDRGTVISLPGDVLFDFDKATIRPDAKVTLAKINQLIEYYKNAPILIEGHTDSKGSDSYNQKLSEQRSQAVRGYLVNQFQVAPTRIQAKGLGETRPVAANTNPNGSDNPAGRQQNRRVEVVLQN